VISPKVVEGLALAWRIAVNKLSDIDDAAERLVKRP
jgi:hypothetical protein